MSVVVVCDAQHDAYSQFIKRQKMRNNPAFVFPRCRPDRSQPSDKYLMEQHSLIIPPRVDLKLSRSVRQWDCQLQQWRFLDKDI